MRSQIRKIILGIIAMTLINCINIHCIQAVETNGSSEALLGVLNQAYEKGKDTDEITIDTTEMNVDTDDNTEEQKVVEVPDRVQSGDLVNVQVTAALSDGAIYYTTVPQIDKDSKYTKVDWYTTPKHFSTEQIVAGQSDPFFPGVADAVLGMSVGEKNTETIASERAFGPPNPKQIIEYPLQKATPKVITLGPAGFVQRYEQFPIVGSEIPITPYFNARVTAVSDRIATLKVEITEGKRIEEPYGVTELEVTDQTVIMTLTPIIGSFFDIGEKKGRIVEVNESVFKVDFNHPLQGQDIQYDLEVVSLTKASQFAGWELPWLEDYDSALTFAEEEGKPTVLALYADWCGFSKRFFNETATDPRIKAMTDKFVWVRIDSNLHSEYKEKFGQDGYPMIVLFNPEGEIVEKIDGFRDAKAFWGELNNCL